jgi:hypothetical protein
LGGLEGSESKSEAESAEDLALKRYLWASHCNKCYVLNNAIGF